MERNEEFVDKTVNVRELIVDMVRKITAKEEQSHILIRQVLKKYNYLEEYDKAFLKRVTEGTLERLISIDYVINLYSSVKVNKMKPLIRSLIRMSVYQILYMDKVPDSAACNEAVKIAEKRGFFKLKAFVNGLLRNIVRNKNEIPLPNRKNNLILFLSVNYSMPEDLLQLLLRQYGEIKCEEILESYFVEKSLSIRLRECLTQEKKEAILNNFHKNNVKVKQHPFLSYAYMLQEMGDITQDLHFLEGDYTVQDVSSMFVCEIADLKRGDRVLDVCSAPGGKAIHACDKLRESGIVEARDVSDYKVSLIIENKRRMQVENLKIKVWDATDYDSDAKEQYDVVLLDIPCSGMGVIGKKPEIKYRLTSDSLKELDILQKKIVDTVWDYVKPGGNLIYSTCTIRKEENEEMIQYITNTYPYELEPIDSYLPKELQTEDSKKGYLTFLPGELNDGFFIAKLLKKRDNMLSCK